MALECELKFINVDLDAVNRRLQEAGGVSSGKYFESNLVFDYPDRSLKSQSVLLRLREKQGKAVLTVKRPPEEKVSSTLKVFEELETSVGDFATMKAALDAVGFRVFFSYEKIREKWQYMDCVICLDVLPFGNFVEIEGTEESVPACARAIGLDQCETTLETYHALNLAGRRDKGLEPNENFVFEEPFRTRMLAELGKE
ncbi:class IV adenylate cyclase [uncultured Pseudodesulfovibrio sp.]|uniref:class IV adenylate cyclase n=1 Tax=uncultured Pseudodesulfovibrio sp. TaxID=2035858 RepID=UPI0029C764C3|nr:class IV adenylate cyclase [uncultured Pseudodesulfovibrio sp.]